jgi:hypothetical protein
MDGTGVLFREATAKPKVHEPRLVMPYFSLYSRDTRMREEIPLLLQLINLNSPADPVGFFVEVIVGLVQDTWVSFVKERGLLSEIHGQNALIELDGSGRPTRLVQRDFQSLYSDRTIREARGLPQFDKHIIGVEDKITREQQYSLVFDHIICGYLLERMTRRLIEYYPRYSFEEIAGVIRQRFSRIPGNPLDVFPKTTYRFAKKPMADNNVELVDTRERPVFR